MDLARIAGALSGAGLFAGTGLGPAYVVIVSLYVISTLLTLCVVVPAERRPAAETAVGALRGSPLRDLREGVAHVWILPRMRAAIWIAFLTNLTAYPFTNGLLPYIAREIYGANQAILGYLSAGFAVGSLIGSITLSLIGTVRVARLMIGTTATWYVGLLVFAHMPSVPTAIVSLTLAGISQSMSMIAIAVILMRTANERFRGRVMGVRMLTIYGLPFGLMAAGSLIDQVGFVATATLYVAAGLAMLAAVALHWRADLWHVHAPANAK
jgi:MFS family permease